MIDAQGFRPCVGIVLVNAQKRLFWGRRIGQRYAWQFPQGGIHQGEEPRDALFRELWEEVGLQPYQVKVMEEIPEWLHYRIPDSLIRQHSYPLCIGQKQKWFLLKCLVGDEAISLMKGSDKPEFDHWCWVNYWYPVKKIVPFKRFVYQYVLREFHNRVFSHSADVVS